MISDSPTAEQAVTAKRGSPWSNLERRLTDLEWDALKKWKAENPDKYRVGDRRSDGLVFIEYSRNFRSGEHWNTIDRLNLERSKAREAKRRWTTPDILRLRREKQRKMYRDRESMRKDARERTKRWRQANKERSAAAIKAWSQMKYATDPIYRKKMSEIGKRRRGRIKGNHRMKYADIRFFGSTQPNRPLPEKSAIMSIYENAEELQQSTGMKHHVDHVIPLNAGGIHVADNLQPLPYRINHGKGDDIFWMSNEYLDFRDVPESIWPDNLKPYYHLMLRIFGHPLKKYAEAV